MYEKTILFASPQDQRNKMMNDEEVAQLIAEAEAAKLKVGDIVCPAWNKDDERIKVIGLLLNRQNDGRWMVQWNTIDSTRSWKGTQMHKLSKTRTLHSRDIDDPEWSLNRFNIEEAR
jgi:hypothetical protein